MKNIHWDYFSALEEDVQHLTRFIQFSQANLNTYSIELAQLLMASTQEVDVLLKQICANNNDQSEKEPGYRNFFINGRYNKIQTIEIRIYRYGLSFKPFEAWANNQTPDWWTANNKVKHRRDTHFEQASLGNMLKSLSGLLIANMYFANEFRTLSTDFVALSLLQPVGLVDSVTGGIGWHRLKIP